MSTSPNAGCIVRVGGGDVADNTVRYAARAGLIDAGFEELHVSRLADEAGSALDRAGRLSTDGPRHLAGGQTLRRTATTLPITRTSWSAATAIGS